MPGPRRDAGVVDNGFPGGFRGGYSFFFQAEDGIRDLTCDWSSDVCSSDLSSSVAGPYPGADLVPDGERGATMAVRIDAPPDQVWPWLVQLGGDRGGWYSWDHLDNAGRPSAQRVHPEWQDIALGDYVKYWTR